jgi:competence protein ComEC
MLRLRTGYIISAILTGLALLTSFLLTLPDGKLHVYFCDVGQGDAAYIRMPDGRDLLIDGGPDNKIIGCLGRHMPFWDRQLDIVVASHLQKDHIGGLIEVLRRYRVKHVVGSGLTNPEAEIDDTLYNAVASSGAQKHVVRQDDQFAAGSVRLRVVWPSDEQVAQMTLTSSPGSGTSVPGAGTADPNDGSVVLLLSYGTFDVLFPGDADNRTNHRFITEHIGQDPTEVLKVPHHGSKNGMNEAFLDWLKPEEAVISVGKNTYGHPSDEAMDLLKKHDVIVHRTDTAGDIEIATDGMTWKVIEQGKRK